MKYYIVKHDGKICQIIDKTGKANKYGEPKIFESMADARIWILRHTYIGASYYFEVKEVKE